METKINQFHKRALRFLYDDFDSNFEELLKMDGSVTIHHKCIQKLTIEIYNIKNKVSNGMLNSFFKLKKSNYILRRNSTFVRTLPSTNKYGIDSVSCLGPKLWEILPTDLRGNISLTNFKNKIKKWVPDHCPFRLCSQ